MTKASLLGRRRGEIEELERDRDTLLDSLEAVAPEVLDALAPEERHHVYRMLQLKVHQYRDGTLEASWAFGKEIIVWNSEITCS